LSGKCVYQELSNEMLESLSSLLAKEIISVSKAIENLQAAQQRAMAVRPKVGGFPYLAETLRRAGVTRNQWFLPACQSIYLTGEGPVVAQGTPLLSGTADVPRFDKDALIAALRTDQEGNSTFPEFLLATWRAGVVRYEVDFAERTCAYYGCEGEDYVEEYPAVSID
jgi:uncharacterized protein YbcV (DUF1398 family)